MQEPTSLEKKIWYVAEKNQTENEIRFFLEANCILSWTLGDKLDNALEFWLKK